MGSFGKREPFHVEVYLSRWRTSKTPALAVGVRTPSSSYAKIRGASAAGTASSVVRTFPSTSM
jgi:hypothetical protein